MYKLLKKLLSLDDRYFFYSIVFIVLVVVVFLAAKSFLLSSGANNGLDTLSITPPLSSETAPQKTLQSLSSSGGSQLSSQSSAEPESSLKAFNNTPKETSTLYINNAAPDALSALELDENPTVSDVENKLINNQVLSEDVKRSVLSQLVDDDKTQLLSLKTDRDVIDDIQDLDGYKSSKGILITETLLKRTVRSVYGISKGQLLKVGRPVVLPKGNFIADDAYKQEGSYVVSLKNYRRYDTYIRILSLVDTVKLANLYRDYAATLESVYQNLELNDPDIKFFQVLLSAIDILIKAPQIDESALLYSTSDGYKFIDENIEALPATSKIMVRMGDENSKRLKAWLRSLKTELEK